LRGDTFFREEDSTKSKSSWYLRHQRCRMYVEREKQKPQLQRSAMLSVLTPRLNRQPFHSRIYRKFWFTGSWDPAFHGRFAGTMRLTLRNQGARQCYLSLVILKR
jgi:hypothetical protein